MLPLGTESLAVGMRDLGLPDCVCISAVRKEAMQIR